jgi:hypothetical protein
MYNLGVGKLGVAVGFPFVQPKPLNFLRVTL